MNQEEQRFHVAVAAMQGLLSNPSVIEKYSDGRQMQVSPNTDVAKDAAAYADALLAELDRTRKESPVQPDADGWIPHVPGDPMPCDENQRVWVRFGSGETDNEEVADYWSWEADPLSPGVQIIAWKPA